MSRRRHDVTIAKATRARRLVALARTEIGRADREDRTAPASATSATIKVVPAETRALIDAALSARQPQQEVTRA